MLAAFPSAAQARVEPSTPLASYAQALAADAAGATERASAGYAAALANAPESELIASRALTYAVSAGDWPLALRAARLLERQEAVLPDARFLLIAEAFRERDWRAAERQIEAVEREQLFGFAAPVLRAWLAVGSGRGDPIAALERAPAGGLAAAYAAEHRPLILIATDRPEGRQLLAETTTGSGSRALRLRLAAAATLAQREERAAALALLEGEDGALAAARAVIEAGRPLPGAVATPAQGMAELLIRLALDMHAEDLTPVAVSFSRLATWLAPESSEAWMVAAELLAQDEKPLAAVELLGNVGDDDPFAAAARDQRIRMLLGAGENERALREAHGAASAEGASVADLVRYAEVLMDRGRAGDAAAAFARALDMHRRSGSSAYPEWALWLFRGGAHDEADQWPEARAALERAYSLAPDQPLVLNYLGYAQLARRENLVEAERLVREAHRLAPDNAAITDSLGWALFLKGRVGEAIPLLERAAEGEPADVEINEHLGDAYFTAGRRLEARFAWTAARVYAEGDDARRLDAKIAAGLTPQLAAR